MQLALACSMGSIMQGLSVWLAWQRTIWSASTTEYSLTFSTPLPGSVGWTWRSTDSLSALVAMSCIAPMISPGSRGWGRTLTFWTSVQAADASVRPRRRRRGRRFVRVDPVLKREQFLLDHSLCRLFCRKDKKAPHGAGLFEVS